MPNFDGFPIESQIEEVKFEAAIYQMLRSEDDIKASRLLYYRAPAPCGNEKFAVPPNILGRRLMIFERKKGQRADIWRQMCQKQRFEVLTQAAKIRATLFNFDLPLDFSRTHFLERLFEQKPKALPVTVSPTRDFCVALWTSKIEATIKDIGDMIGWESGNNAIGPVAFDAKQSLLQLIPRMLPAEPGDTPVLYRLVLEHGDFGIHNMTIDDTPNITSLFDWETGSITLALLSDTHMAVAGADLVIDDDGRQSITRVSRQATTKERAQHTECTERYHEALFTYAPEYKQVIDAGKDARHLCFALRDWRGDDPEAYFGTLGDWSKEQLQQLEV